MIDFAQARRTMVDGQVRVNDVTEMPFPYPQATLSVGQTRPCR